MKFEIVTGCKIGNAEEQYIINDRTFNCFPYINVDISIAVAYLNLGVDSEDMCVKCLWGFSPRESWRQVELSVPEGTEGALRLVGEYEAGFTWRIDGDKMWESYFDQKSGWYCIGNPTLEEENIAVKMINNLLVVVNNVGELKAVWIHPIFV